MTTISKGVIPRDPQFDSSLAFKAEGYRFIGERCRRFGSDIFGARLLGKRFYCVQGEDAARMFYEPGRFTRNGALPASVLKLLQDKNSVATLDAAAHRHRKAMFMSLMTPARLHAMARLAADELRTAAEGWQARGRVRLHREFRAVLCRAACAWAGVPLDGRRARILTRQIGAMIDNAGVVGPANWVARVRRWGTEAFLQRVIETVRTGRLTPPDNSATYVVAFYRDEDGALLAPEVAAVELLNILRPTVAIARFMTFAALALHRHPEHRNRLVADDAFLQAWRCCRDWLGGVRALVGVAGSVLSDPGCHLALQVERRSPPPHPQAEVQGNKLARLRRQPAPAREPDGLGHRGGDRGVDR